LEDPGKDTDYRIMELVDCLLHGDRCFAMMLADAAGFENDDEERRTWQLNKDLLLSMVSEDLNKDFRYLVGNRPWAWWKYESGLGAEIWGDFDRFYYDWHRWQYDYLQEHGLISPEEEEKVRRFCARVLAWGEYSLEDPDLPELELRRRREKRKPFELD